MTMSALVGQPVYLEDCTLAYVATSRETQGQQWFLVAPVEGGEASWVLEQWFTPLTSEEIATLKRLQQERPEIEKALARCASHLGGGR